MRSLTTGDILLKEHDTRLLPFKTKEKQTRKFSFGNRNEDILNFSSYRKLIVSQYSEETHPNKGFCFVFSLVGNFSAEYTSVYHFSLQEQLFWPETGQLNVPFFLPHFSLFKASERVSVSC